MLLGIGTASTARYELESRPMVRLGRPAETAADESPLPGHPRGSSATPRRRPVGEHRSARRRTGPLATAWPLCGCAANAAAGGATATRE